MIISYQRGKIIWKKIFKLHLQAFCSSNQRLIKVNLRFILLVFWFRKNYLDSFPHCNGKGICFWSFVNNEIIEIKGYYDINAKLKHEQNPDIKILFKKDLENALKSVKDFKPKDYKSNTKKMVKLIENEIEKLY